MSASQLIGAWRLVSLEGRFDDGQITRPLGEDVDGYLIYSAEGWVSAMLLKANRKPLASGQRSLTLLSAEEREYVLSSITMAYQGTYQVEGNVVTHHVRAAVNPTITGSYEVRTFELDGAKLTIVAPPVQTPRGQLINTLVWRRAES